MRQLCDWPKVRTTHAHTYWIQLLAIVYRISFVTNETIVFRAASCNDGVFIINGNRTTTSVGWSCRTELTTCSCNLHFSSCVKSFRMMSPTARKSKHERTWIIQQVLKNASIFSSFLWLNQLSNNKKHLLPVILYAVTPPE